jgi:hypothetical protein
MVGIYLGDDEPSKARACGECGDADGKLGQGKPERFWDVGERSADEGEDVNVQMYQERWRDSLDARYGSAGRRQQVGLHLVGGDVVEAELVEQAPFVGVHGQRMTVGENLTRRQ